MPTQDMKEFPYRSIILNQNFRTVQEKEAAERRQLEEERKISDKEEFMRQQGLRRAGRQK